MPFDAATATPIDNQPASGGFDPATAKSVSAPSFKFADSAINGAVKSGASVVWMHPDKYLALTPEFDGNPRNDRKGASLKKSLEKGDEVDEVPSLDVTVGKDGTGKVVDQDGRHRAQFAKDHGVDLIPVAVKRSGEKGQIKNLAGMRDGSEPVPFDFNSVTPVPEKTEPKKPGTSVASRFARGVKDPLVGLGQLEAHGAEAVTRAVGATKAADAIEGYIKPRDTAIAKDEAEYQMARRDAAGGKDPGWDLARTAGDIASPVNYVPLGTVSKLGEAAVLAKRAEPVIKGLVRSVARQAATTGTGGAVIAALNPVTGGDFWDDKTKQAAIGFGAGTVAPPVFTGASKALIKAGSATVAPLVRYMAGIKGPNAALSAAEQEIMRRLGQGTAGGGPTAQDMLDMASRTPDKPLTLMDVGSQPVNALAGRVYRSGGEAKQKIGDALVGRVNAQGQRLEGDVGKGLSGQKAYSTTQAMMQSRGNAAAPLYKDAYAANPSMASPFLDRVLETPAGKDALSRARVKMQNDLTKMGTPDKELAEQMREAGQDVPKGGVSPGLSLRTWDYIKRAYGDMETEANRAGRADDARIFKDRRREITSALDDLDVTAKAGPNSTKAAGGLYKQARAAYSGPSQSMEALEFGQNALKPSTSIDENAARFKELNTNDQEFARIGLAQSLREMIGKKDVGTNAARTLAKNPAIQQRIRPFFRSDADYQKFINSATAEDNMFHASQRTMGGSQTAERLEEDNDLRSSAMRHAAEAGIHLSGGNVIGAGTSLMKALSDYSRSPNPEFAGELSNLLTEPLNHPGSRGMDLLRHFSSVAPATKNYLAQATNRAARAATVPAGVAAGQAPNP